MKLETKYGVLEGTVEEFRELLNGKVSRSWSFPSKGYKVVNKNTDNEPTKGTVLKHIILNNYEDTLGNQYIIYDDVLDDCTDIGIGDLFKGSKERGSLLKQEVDKSEYYIINNDTIEDTSGVRIPKGLVLKHLIGDRYVDTTGNKYLIDDKDLDDYNKTWVDDKFKSYKDKGILLIQKEDKYKVVKEDIYSLVDGNKVLEKGTVLLETEYNYEDSLGERFIINPETVENKLIDICDSRTGLHFEGNKRNNKLFKVGLP